MSTVLPAWAWEDESDSVHEPHVILGFALVFGKDEFRGTPDQYRIGVALEDALKAAIPIAQMGGSSVALTLDATYLQSEPLGPLRSPKENNTAVSMIAPSGKFPINLGSTSHGGKMLNTNWNSVAQLSHDDPSPPTPLSSLEQGHSGEGHSVDLEDRRDHDH